MLCKLTVCYVQFLCAPVHVVQSITSCSVVLLVITVYLLMLLNVCRLQLVRAFPVVALVVSGHVWCTLGVTTTCAAISKIMGM